MDEIRDIPQDELDGFVPQFELAATVGAQTQAERDAACNVAFRTYRVVKAEDIADLRTDDPTDDAQPYLTTDEARKVLPPTYRPRKVGGAEYPALHHPKTTVIRGYGASLVREARERLAAHRAEVEAKRKRLAEDRAGMFERWMAGDADVRLRFEVASRGWDGHVADWRTL